MDEQLSQYGYTEVMESEFGDHYEEDKLYRKLMELFDEFQNGSKWIRGKWMRNRHVFLSQGLGIPLADGQPRAEAFNPLNQPRNNCDRPPTTSTPILYSTYENLCSDAIELQPEAVFLGRSEDDGALADNMTAIFRSLLDRRNFKTTYAEWVRTRSQFGMAVVETMWDETLDNGEGDVDLQVWSPDDIWLDPLYENIQDGRAVFKVTYHHPSWFKEHYPDKIARMYDGDHPLDDTDDISYIEGKETSTLPLYEVWCRRWDAEKKRHSVHMYKLAGGVVLENSEKTDPKGMYAHGEYPFTVSAYDRIPGTPWGMGPMDYLCPVQEYISEMDDLILQNTKASAKPRLYVTQASGIDPKKLADGNEQVIMVQGNNLDCLKWETGQPLNPVALQMYVSKTETLKTESGQNAASRGEVPGSVTAASAIGLLQSAGSKRANLSQYNLNNSFVSVVRQMVSCMMQFYDKKRVFRQRGTLVESDQTFVFDPKAYRGRNRSHEWLYDLDVKIQRESTFQTAYTNQTVLSFLQMGAIDASDAIMLLDLPNKDAIRLAVDKNNRIKQTLQNLMAEVQNLRGQQAAAQQENQELMMAAEETPEIGAVEAPDMGGNPMFATAAL